MTPKVIASGVKQTIYGQSLHSTYHYILFGSPFLKLASLGPHKNDSTPGVVHI